MMRRLRLAGAALLELDPLDLLLIASVVRYGLEVRSLVTLRRGNREQLAEAKTPGAGGPGHAGAVVDGNDGAGPDYAREAEQLGDVVDLVDLEAGAGE